MRKHGPPNEPRRLRTAISEVCLRDPQTSLASREVFSDESKDEGGSVQTATLSFFVSA